MAAVIVTMLTKNSVVMDFKDIERGVEGHPNNLTQIGVTVQFNPEEAPDPRYKVMIDIKGEDHMLVDAVKHVLLKAVRNEGESDVTEEQYESS